MERNNKRDRIEEVLFQAFEQISESRKDIKITYSPNSGCLFFTGSSGTQGRLEAKYTLKNTIALYLTIRNNTVQTEESNLQSFVSAIIQIK